MIGRTRSWLCWLAGALCALIFGANSRAGEAQAKYGVQLRPIRPPADNPAVTAEQKQKAEQLVADYLAPVAAVEPTADQKTAIAKLVQDFGSADFKTREDASARAGKLGPEALGQLREASASKDAEVSTRAAAAIAAVETAARQGTVEELKKVRDAAAQAVSSRMNEARTAQAKAAQAAAAAEKAGQAEEAAKARAEAAGHSERVNALAALMRQIMPMVGGPGGPAQALYGVRMVEPVD